MKRIALLLWMIVLAGCAVAPRTGARGPEAVEVVAVAERLFDAMGQRDSAAIAALFTPHARIIALWDDDRGYRDRGVGEFAADIADAGTGLRERMWNPEVRVAGDLATLWARYDLYRRWEFSHCGVDAFQMVRVDGKWLIAALSFTAYAQDCPPAPPFEP